MSRGRAASVAVLLSPQVVPQNTILMVVPQSTVLIYLARPFDGTVHTISSRWICDGHLLAVTYLIRGRPYGQAAVSDRLGPKTAGRPARGV